MQQITNTSLLAVFFLAAFGASASSSLFAASSPVQEHAFYVSPKGDDAAAGTEKEPFATIARAQRAVRELKACGGLTAPVVVDVLGGTYSLHEPLVFAPEDSGTAECPVTYRGSGGSPAVISGGKRLTGFHQSGKLWTLALDDVKAGEWYFNQLYVNGHRRLRARTPNDGTYFRIRSSLPDAKESCLGFIYAADDVRPWQNLDDAVFVVFGSWYNTIHHVDKLDVPNKTVWFTNRSSRPFNWYEKNLRYYVENIAEGLDQPGEWYLNRKSGVLSYYPLPGETIETASVIAPVVRQTLVRFQGDPGKGRYVEYVNLENLQIRHTDAHLPKDLYDARQAATVQDAGIMADGARHCKVEGCEVANMGEHGIWFRDDCDHNVIRRCHVHDLGGGGIYIGEKWRWGNDCPGWRGYRNFEDIPHFAEHNVVDNCLVHDGCYIFTGSIGIWVGQASYTTVSHNDVCDMSYSGISAGWDWSGNKSTAHHNIIELNHIHHLGHHRMNDMAGIYTLGVSPGTVLRNNVIHDVQAYQSSVGYCLGAGIYLDQSSGEITIQNNVCYDISNAGFFLHLGANNRVVNNVLADLDGKGRIGWGMYFTARAGHADEGNLATGNIVYGSSPKMAKATRNGKGPSDEGSFAFVAIDKNLYGPTQGSSPTFSVSHNDTHDGVLEFANWRNFGFDTNSVMADPLFIDAAAHDYRLQPESPARKLGIQSIDTADAGLYGDANWTDLPKRIRLRELDAESAFTPAAILTLAEDYEGKRVGFVPDHVQKADRAKGATIDVTDTTAADGKKCLRFADAPGLEEPYHPNRVWRNLHVNSGTVKLSFDCMSDRDAPATFSVEMRDWSGAKYSLGPSLLFQPDGKLRVGRDRYVPFKPGRWYHVQIQFELGDNAPQSFEFAFAPKGETTELLAIPFMDSGFNVLTWFGLLVMDRDRHSKFYVDNLILDMN